MENKYNKEQTLDIIEIINTAFKGTNYSHTSIHEYLSSICWFFVSEQYDYFIYRAIEISIAEKRYEPSINDRLHLLTNILFNDNIDNLPLYAVGNGVAELIKKEFNNYRYEEFFYSQLIMKFSAYRLTSKP